MDKYLEMWEPVLRNFEEHYAAQFEEDGLEVPDHVVDWYPSGYLEITVKMNSGQKLLYEFVGNRIIPINYDRDEKTESLRNAMLNSEESWQDNFSKRLRIRMRRQGISQDKLSELSGISKVTISRYMNGLASPSGYNLDRISNALGCSSTELTSVY